MEGTVQKNHIGCVEAETTGMPCLVGNLFQWEFQDAKTEVLSHINHIKPYFGGISAYIALNVW